MGRRQNNPSIGCVHPKSTHGRPLAWGNKKLKNNQITTCLTSIQFLTSSSIKTANFVVGVFEIIRTVGSLILIFYSKYRMCDSMIDCHILNCPLVTKSNTCPTLVWKLIF
jgi:hypothetical protein